MSAMNDLAKTNTEENDKWSAEPLATRILVIQADPCQVATGGSHHCSGLGARTQEALRGVPSR